MTAIGFLGLGQMGSIMASHFVDAGHDVKVWNRTPAKADALRDRGASVAATPAEAAADADVVCTMLRDAPALEEVVFGAHGLAGTIRPGAVLIDFSTVGPEPIRGIAERLPDGVDVLDAPVRGSVDKARAATLGIVVGGSREVFERWRGLLETLGTPTHVGSLGAGQAAKVANNAAAIAAVALVGEVVGLAERLGMDRSAAFDLLEGTTLGEAVRYVRSRVEPGDLEPRFKAELAEKDLRLAIEASPERELRLVNAAVSWYEDVAALGLGDLDFTAAAAVASGDRRPTGAGGERPDADPDGRG